MYIIDYQMDTRGSISLGKAGTFDGLDDVTPNVDHRERGDNLREQARIHLITGSQFFHGGELSKAYEYYDKVLRLYTILHDKLSTTEIYGKLGLILYRQGFFFKSIVMSTNQLASAQKNNRFMCLEAHGLMGDAYIALGMLSDAKNSYDLSSGIATDIGDARCIALERGRQGILHELSGDLESALVCYNYQLEHSIEAMDSYLLASVYTYMASVFSKMNMSTLAIQYQHNAMRVARRIGDLTSEGVILDGLGVIYQYIHEYHTAVHFHTQALNIAILVQDKMNEAIACGNLGVAYYKLYDLDTAKKYMKRDLNITITSEDSVGVGITSTNLHILNGS
jgi:tetratricopeptide (TPR) repeat protein